MKFIARVTILFTADDQSTAHSTLSSILPDDWEYVSIDGVATSAMPVSEPSLDEIFDAALDNES